MAAPITLATYYRSTGDEVSAAKSYVCNGLTSDGSTCGRTKPAFLFIEVAGRPDFPNLNWACTSCVVHADTLLVEAANNITADLTPAPVPSDFEAQLDQLLLDTGWIGDPIFPVIAPAADVTAAFAWRETAKGYLNTPPTDPDATIAQLTSTEPAKPANWPTVDAAAS
jgi:hypothetical protein